MRKRLCFLLSILFLVGVCAAAKGATPIADREFNFSWEYDPNGELILCHTGEMADSLAWNDNGHDWSGVDVNCGHEGPDCDNCKDGYRFPDGNVVCFVNGGSATFQLLDPNINPDVNIVAGRKYTMLLDLYTYDDWYFDISFYYSTDPCWIPDVDANEIVQESFLLGEIIFEPTGRGDWFFDRKVSFVATPGADYIGERLGIHLNNPYAGGTWLFADNVRLEWEWATNAYNPSPEDGERYVLQDKDLSWKPGLWAAEHIVYFGTDWEDVNNRSRTGGASDYTGDVNSFEPGTLELGATYYWTVTEVNDSYDPLPGVADPPWIGDIWSFTVEGAADNPSPADGAKNESIYTILSWTQGTVSESHDVYLGTDFDAVNDANNSLPVGTSVYKGNLAYEVNSYDPPGLLDLEQTYYWRIDEVRNSGADVIKGYIWSFTVAPYLMIDDMESYALSGKTEITDTWESDWDTSTAQISLQTVDGDANYVHGGENSMEYWYTNYSPPYEALCELPFDSSQDWTVAGFKVLTLYLRGYFDNEAGAIQPLYIQISDGTNTGTVQYEDSNDLVRGWMGWQEWNIELQDFVDDAPSLNLAAITKLGIKVGDGSYADEGYIYFDDIRLYPSRCLVDKATGSFTNDCDVDLYDLSALARDWLLSGIGSVSATVPSDTDLYGYWMMNDNATTSEVLDSSGNGKHGVLYDAMDTDDEPVEGETADHSITPGAVDGYALAFDGFDDYVDLPALNESSNTVTITAWIKREFAGNIYEGIVMSSNAWTPKGVNTPDPNYTAGLELGADTVTWAANYELAYMWTGYSWEWHSGLFVPPDEWTFTALTVAPEVATLYVSDGISLEAARNYDSHEPLPWNTAFHIADQMQFGPPSEETERFFHGAIDEVRIYNRTLTPNEIASLAGVSSADIPLEPWRANADGDDDVDLADYAMMADNWLAELLWP